MYKLMLVDDEADVREGMLGEVDWAGLGIEVIATAENGKEALDMLDRVTPDVVVTDISMPYMNGLELAEKIRELRPTVKIIIFTGFDEFEYARRAIKLHIDEYLLKPFSSQEFTHVLRKVKQTIDEEIDARKNIETLREHYRQSLPLLQQLFLSSLMSRKLTILELHSHSELCGLQLEGGSFIVAVIRVDSQPEEDVGLASDKALQLFALYNIAGEIAGRLEPPARAFIHGHDVVILASGPETSRNSLIYRISAAMEEIRQGVEKYLKCTVTIGLGTPIGRLVDAKEAYDSAAQALDYRLLLGNNRVILIGDVEQRTPTPAARFDELKQQALMRCIKVGTEPELLTIISELFRELSDTGGTVMDLQLYLLELVTAIFRVAKEVGTAIEQVPSSETSLFAQIDRFQNLEEAKHWAVHVSIRLMRQIASERRSTQRSLIEQAKEYVKGHYADPELSVQKLCGELYISAGYFSGLFKKETRQTFVAYLQQFRMEIAKELLCTTDMKAFEIAEKAGYADPNYFSFSFKKLYGISPKEYRSSARVPVDE